MKRWTPVIAFFALAALSPAPINDTRPLVKQPELSEAERGAQQRGVTMGNMGTIPDRTENVQAPSITGDSDASKAILDADKQGSSSGSQRGADAVKKASQDLAMSSKPNYGRLFGGLLIIVAAFGLFQVFRMWANKALPDAPANFK